MTTTQKLDLSREIRQWIGTGISIASVIFMGYEFWSKIFKNFESVGAGEWGKTCSKEAK